MTFHFLSFKYIINSNKIHVIVDFEVKNFDALLLARRKKIFLEIYVREENDEVASNSLFEADISTLAYNLSRSFLFEISRRGL